MDRLPTTEKGKVRKKECPKADLSSDIPVLFGLMSRKQGRTPGQGGGEGPGAMASPRTIKFKLLGPRFFAGKSFFKMTSFHLAWID